MSSNFIPINVTPIRLVAYSTANLPVSYRIITGTDIVSLTNQGTYWEVSPLAIGSAILCAYQEGNSEYGPALPVLKTVRVIGLPDELNVEAKIIEEPTEPTLVEIEILEPPVAPSANNLLDTTPLEPSEVTYEKRGPSAPTYVTFTIRPEELTNVTAEDRTGYPNGDPIDVRAIEIFAPFEPQMNYVSVNIPPYMHYAKNLTYYKSNEIITFATTDTKSFTESEFWENEYWRDRYLGTTYDTLGLIQNVGFTFSSREALSVQNFNYINSRNIAGNGTYGSIQGYDTNDRYRTYYAKEKHLDGTDIAQGEEMYMMFIACKYQNILIFEKEIPFTNQTELETAKDYIATTFLSYNAHISQTGYQNWYIHILTQYGDIFGNPYNAYSGALGMFVIDSDINASRLIKPKTLMFKNFSLNEYTNYLSADQHNLASYNDALENLPSVIELEYDVLAGDIQRALNDYPNTQVKHHPAIPVPFKETFNKSTTGYHGNIYEVKGANVTLNQGYFTTDVDLPSDIQATIQ